MCTILEIYGGRIHVHYRALDSVGFPDNIAQRLDVQKKLKVIVHLVVPVLLPFP